MEWVKHTGPSQWFLRVQREEKSLFAPGAYVIRVDVAVVRKTKRRARRRNSNLKSWEVFVDHKFVSTVDTLAEAKNLAVAVYRMGV